MNTTALFFIALIYTALCNPLGQTTVCESSQPVGTTVYESTSNIPYYPYGLPAGLGLAGLLSNANPLALSGLPVPGLGTTTVYENIPNVGGLGGLGLGGLGVLNPLNGLPLGLPYGLAGTVPGLLGVGQLGLPYPVPTVGTGSSTVCESTSNVGVGPLGLPIPLGGMGLGGLGLGGLGLGGLGLGGLGLGLAQGPFPFL
ncbi:unnamed protein product, partial [Iphiclides podalirius]